MKIHIVQKGDTLWDIAQSYGVDFEELKEVNSQISSPDMMMPGMKIKIPASTKAVKKESKKEMKKEEKTSEKQSVKPVPIIEEDEKDKKVEVKPEMPLPQMPQPPPVPEYPMMPMPEMEVEKKDTFQKPNVMEEKKKLTDKETGKEKMYHTTETYDQYHEQSETDSHPSHHMIPGFTHMPPHEPVFYPCIPCIPIHPMHLSQSPCCNTMPPPMPNQMPIHPPTHMPNPMPNAFGPPMPEMQHMMMPDQQGFPYSSEIPMQSSHCDSLNQYESQQMHLHQNEVTYGKPNHVGNESMHYNEPMETYPSMNSQTNFSPVPPTLRSNEEE